MIGTHHLLIRALTLVAIAASSAASTEHQQQAAFVLPTSRLRIEPSPFLCTNEQDFRRGVIARLWRDPFVSDGDAEIVIRARVERDDLLIVVVEALLGGVSLGRRELEGSSRVCSELVARAELVTSVFLGPPPYSVRGIRCCADVGR